MSKELARVLVECVPNHESQCKLALEEASKYCDEQGVGELVLIVPTLQSALGTVVAQVLGQEATKALLLRKSIALRNSGARLSMLPAAKAAHATHGSILVCVHLASSDIAKVDDILSPVAIVYCPWTEDEGKRWLRTWQPVVWGAQTWQVAPFNLHPDVEAALQTIHATVNVPSNLLHAADKELVTNTFKALRKKGRVLDAGDIHIWALRNGWTHTGAGALAKVAKRYE